MHNRKLKCDKCGKKKKSVKSYQTTSNFLPPYTLSYFCDKCVKTLQRL